VGYNILQDMGFDVLREFWPEVSLRFELPFRGEPDLMSHDSNPPANKLSRDAWPDAGGVKFVV